MNEITNTNRLIADNPDIEPRCLKCLDHRIHTDWRTDSKFSYCVRTASSLHGFLRCPNGSW